MYLSKVYSILFILVFTMLQGCDSQKPPEEVAGLFWHAVVSNDSEKIQEYVAKDTLNDVSLLSNKEKMLTAVEVGAVTTKETGAEVETTLIGQQDGTATRLPVTTYLVLEEEQWKVHGQQSVNALVATSMNLMMNDITGNLSELGEALSDSISGGLQEFISAFSKEVPSIKEELSKLSNEDKTRDIGQKLGKLFSDGLGQAMKDINKGLDELSAELDKAAKDPVERQSEKN